MYIGMKYFIALSLVLSLNGCGSDSGTSGTGSNAYTFSKTDNGFKVSIKKVTSLDENFMVSIDFQGEKANKQLMLTGYKGTVSMECSESAATIGYRTLYSCITKYNTENPIAGQSSKNSELYLSSDSYKVYFKESYVSTDTRKKVIGTYLVR